MRGRRRLRAAPPRRPPRGRSAQRRPGRPSGAWRDPNSQAKGERWPAPIAARAAVAREPANGCEYQGAAVLTAAMEPDVRLVVPRGAPQHKSVTPQVTMAGNAIPVRPSMARVRSVPRPSGGRRGPGQGDHRWMPGEGERGGVPRGLHGTTTDGEERCAGKSFRSFWPAVVPPHRSSERSSVIDMTRAATGTVAPVAAQIICLSDQDSRVRGRTPRCAEWCYRPGWGRGRRCR
jgi:hypothetical protein